MDENQTPVAAENTDAQEFAQAQANEAAKTDAARQMAELAQGAEARLPALSAAFPALASEAVAVVAQACGGGRCFDPAHRVEAETVLTALLDAAKKAHAGLSEIHGCEPLGHVRGAVAHICNSLENALRGL